MTIQINGTSGISGVDGSAATPALQGTDTNTGISFGTDEVSVVTGGTQRALVDSTGYLRLAGAGIQFNGDTAAANALDDYEEGTWTPSLKGSTAGTGSFSANASANGGIYRKIGNVVYFQGNLSGTWTNGTASGNAQITGLPVACRSTGGTGEGAAAYSPVTFPYMQGITPATSGYYRTGGLVMPGQTYMDIYQGNGNGGVQTSHIITEVSTSAGAVNWHFSGFYPVA